MLLEVLEKKKEEGRRGERGRIPAEELEDFFRLSNASPAAILYGGREEGKNIRKKK